MMHMQWHREAVTHHDVRSVRASQVHDKGRAGMARVLSDSRGFTQRRTNSFSFLSPYDIIRSACHWLVPLRQDARLTWFIP